MFLCKILVAKNSWQNKKFWHLGEASQKKKKNFEQLILYNDTIILEKESGCMCVCAYVTNFQKYAKCIEN